MNELIGSIKLKFFKNPDSVRDSGDFEIMIKDMNSNIIAKSFQPFQLLKESLDPGSLQSAHIIPSNTTVAAPNDIMV